jgi:predicted DNA-binding transcriptional regulator AlpA
LRFFSAPSEERIRAERAERVGRLKVKKKSKRQLPSSGQLGGSSESRIDFENSAIQSGNPRSFRNIAGPPNTLSPMCQGPAVTSPKPSAGFSRYKILRMRELVQILSVKRSTIYRMVDRRELPRPIAISTHARGWLQSDVENFIRERANQSRNPGREE